jgi:hypothetical protein
MLFTLTKKDFDYLKNSELGGGGRKMDEKRIKDPKTESL